MPQLEPGPKRKNPLFTLLHRYISYLILKAFCMTLGLLMLVFLLGTAFKLLRDDLVFSQLLKVLPFALFYTLPYLLPVSLLAAVTLAYGQLVADHEILAMRASGMTPWQIMGPGIIPGLLLSFLTLALEASVLPILHWKRNALSSTLIEEFVSLGQGEHKSFRLDASNLSLYIRKFANGQLSGIVLRKREAAQDIKVIAKQGKLHVNPERQVIGLDLHKVSLTIYQLDHQGRMRAFARVFVERIKQEIPLGKTRKPKIRDFSSREVLKILEHLENTRALYALKGFLYGCTTHYSQDQSQDRRIRAQFYSRFVRPFGSLVFVLIGIPITLLLKSENRLQPFFLSFLVVVLVFFLPFMLGNSLAGKGQAHFLLLWLGPFCGLLTGAALTVVAARSS